MNETFIRYSVLVSLIIMTFTYLIYILLDIQVFKHENYHQIRNKQNEYVSQENKRGTIYATLKNGEYVALAEDKTFYKLVISPKDIPDNYETRLYKLLNEITEIDKEVFMLKIKNKNDTYVQLKIISEDERQKIEELGIQGVLTFKTFKRNYGLNSVGARTIGFVGGGEDGFLGRYGLEKFYESELRSQAKSNISFFANIFEREEKIDDKSSKDIITSLEPNVMKYVAQVLSDMKDEWGADEVSMIVMDTETGKILAMDTLPEFDPNNYKDFDLKYFGNPSVQGVYELGSIMKPITLSGALEKDLITPETVYKDYGFLKIDNYTIKNFDGKARGDQTMQDVISNSLNTGAVYVQKLMGKEYFKENFVKFGLEKQTGIDFPGEVTNKTDNLETDTDVNFATAAFGQGVAITPISMLSSLNIIPNYGKSTCPHFITKKVLSDGTEIDYNCNYEIEQVVSTSTASTMAQMLVNLIDTGLAKGKYKDENYKVGAKTGTAQLPSPDGKYYKDKFIHSYFTFFPKEDPKFSVLIYQVNPQKGALASLTLAPAATKVKDFLLTYYNVPPDRN